MDKILSINTIKNVFSALGAKTSDSNYGVALLDKTTAEPKGLMGMSDLASVLGVLALNGNGMTTGTCGSDGVGELFKVNGEGCGIMVFQFDGNRYGVFGFNNNKITPISPSVYISCNTTDQTYNLYVDQNTKIIYFKAVANRTYGYKIINSIGII